MRRLIGIAAAFAAVAACASSGAPPGGAERHTPPEIVEITVDSGQTNVNIKSVEFKFDEVVSDRPAGAGAALDQIFLISPRDGAPVVSWHRTRVDVRPRKGFRPNTAYRITMLPGLMDLRNNVRKDTRTIVFSTGPTFPPFKIIGRVFDWAAERPAIGAYVEAISRPDTNIVYVTATDTAGMFDVGPLPAGTYTVRALIDQNANRIVDRNEKWDTTTVTFATASPSVELDAVERDSVPPNVDDVSIIDSVTFRARFDKPLDPALPLQPALVRVQRPDSTALEVTSVQWANAYDRRRDAQTQDSLRRADTTRARPPAAAPAVPATPTPTGQRPPPPPPKPKAPPPERAIVVTLAPTNPLVVGSRYIITFKGMRNLVGNSRDVRRVLEVPKPVPRDTTKRTPADTTRRPPAPPRRPPG
ncbi:MAG: hypothetical protein JWM41_2201 [Gemmatimonadetes bacterium]|nr:hypothetical protein [Gemmatimonadota bacterium]